MHQLIVAIDGSEQSRGALRYAAGLAETAGASIEVLEVWDHPGVPQEAADRVAELEEELLDQLRDLVESELGEDAGKVRCRLQRGRPAEVLLEAAPRGILVLGSRGLGGFSGLLLGSVSHQCVEHAEGPVLVVREAPRSVAAPIVVGVDCSPTSEKAVGFAVELGEALGTEVVAVHAWWPRFSEVRPHVAEQHEAEAAEAAQRSLRESGFEDRVRLEVVEANPRDALLSVAQEVGAATVVVGRRGEGLGHSLGLGSVAHHLVRAAPNVVAVVPPA